MPRFITKKWVIVHDQSGSADDRYKPNKQIRFNNINAKTRFLWFYNVAKGTITLDGAAKEKKKKLKYCI